MATSFPVAKDTFANPSPTDTLNAALVPHAAQHANVNDAVKALQNKVGITGSTDVNSLDYKTRNPPLVLGSTVYNPGSLITYTTAATTFAAVDVTNLSLTFTPVTTRAMIQMIGRSHHTTSGYIQWCLLDASGVEVVNTRLGVHYSTSYVTAFYQVLLTGLTPGTPVTFQWGWRTTTGTAYLMAGDTNTPSDPGPVSMYALNA